jgi:ABC-type transporter Mla MlaB component
VLRITVIHGTDQVTFKLEGKLAGPWVPEVEQCWLTMVGAKATQDLRVDLTNVTFVASEGVALLERMVGGGAELLAADPMMKALVEEVLARARDARGSPGDDHGVSREEPRPKS